MTTCIACAGGTGTGWPGACGTQGCQGHDEDVVADPFLALRVAFGMLLGEDEFRVLMGNPRGKLMLHNAWLHDAGVVHGLGVRKDAHRRAVVEPGLAIDGVGRELRLTVRQCLDLDAWVKAYLARNPVQDVAAEGGETGAGCEDLTAWVVLRYRAVPDAPAPALADPTDVTRRHDACSRLVETAWVDVTDAPPPTEHAYPRLHRIVGMPAGSHAAEVVRDVDEAWRRVDGAEPEDRRSVLLEQLQRLARSDAAARRPAAGPEGVVPQFPVPDGIVVPGGAGTDPGVALARLQIRVTTTGACTDVAVIDVEPCVARPVVPTGTLHDLMLAVLARILDRRQEHDAGGPRLCSVRWEDRRTVRLTFDRPILPGSWEGAVEVSSLEAGADKGWRIEHINEIAADGDAQILVRLDGRPAYRHVRVLVRGTGPTPLYGREPFAVFAGPAGGPACTAHDGRDAADVTDLGDAEKQEVAR